ncbi:M15 family metallopeptidase [Paenibacillus tepidiphilus]|uniref:M15 family metallopeptidase n=1 Tax=Paenibacillus tepidiphilus TaxID=2608683 RepID=UPI00193EB861|nr:M15 family metallopeptidase [Paenibacillus tepidiphilus]
MLDKRQVGIRVIAAALSLLVLGLGSLLFFTGGQAALAAAGAGKQPNAAAQEAKAVKKNNLPQGFVYLDEVIPSAQFEIRYYTSNNFVGARIDGYKAPLAIFSRQAAAALKKVSDDLAQKGYILHIYDAYRPQKAVNHFLRWSQDTADVKMKSQYYPKLDKRNLFKLGFIAKKSGHSRGSTVDLTLADKKTGAVIDMGSPFDFFGEISYYNTPLVSAKQHANRKVLKDAMEKRGFKYYSKEWWHFTLRAEPYPSTYFNFDVE